MKKQTTLALIVATVLGAGLAAQAQSCGTGDCKSKKSAPAKKAQTTCPVMGGKVDKSLYADVDGKRIYVCCPGCVAKVKANPGKYIKKLEAEGVQIAKTPKKKAASNEHDHAPIKGYAEHEK